MENKYFFLSQIKKSLFLSTVVYVYYNLLISRYLPEKLTGLTLGNCSREEMWNYGWWQLEIRHDWSVEPVTTSEIPDTQFFVDKHLWSITKHFLRLGSWISEENIKTMFRSRYYRLHCILERWDWRTELVFILTMSPWSIVNNSMTMFALWNKNWWTWD